MLLFVLVEVISLITLTMSTYSVLPIQNGIESPPFFITDYAISSRENIVPHKQNDSDFAPINVKSTYNFTFTVNS